MKFQGPSRGYFAVGAEGIQKARNLGALMRSAHAFGASFVFTVGSPIKKSELYKSDTSKTFDQLPLYQFDGVDDLALPERCEVVGVELTDEAIALPSFRHPLRAVYILGPERGALSPELLERCDHVVKIPTAFCINVATAGAVFFYDRCVSMGRFAPRPVSSGGPTEFKPEHVQGGPVLRKLRNAQK